jgi:hypothetical protein
LDDYFDISSDLLQVMVNDLPCHHDVDVDIMDEGDLVEDGEEVEDDFHEDLVEVLDEGELVIKIRII